MYQRFYSLRENPFRLSPNPDYMCMTPQHQEALAGLIYSVCTHPGLTVLVGEAGTGKTTLLYSLLGLLEKRRFVTAMCTNPTLTREEFYDLVLMKFGVVCPSPLKSRRLAALEETLRRNQADGRPSVLIVDEAQRLSTELLEEIRLLLNTETPRQKLLEIIIAGQPELTDTLRRPELRQLKQRVSCICELRPLSLDELKEYLHFRVTRAGLATQSLFPEPIIEQIHEYSGGIPRLVNSLCDSVLRTGFAMQSRQITAAIVEEAARDLDLLRNAGSLDQSWNTQKSSSPATGGPAEAPPAPANGTSSNGKSGRPEAQMPLEGYTARQKSLNFFGGLMDRWK